MPDAGYEGALERWKGAAEESLVAAWGAPALVEAAGDERRLVYVRRDSVAPGAPPETAVSQTGVHGFAVTGGLHLAPAATPTCTTRFTIRQGTVQSWDFEGPACRLD